MTIAEQALKESKAMKEAVEQHVRKSLLEQNMPNIKKMVEEKLLQEFEDENDLFVNESKSSDDLKKEEDKGKSDEEDKDMDESDNTDEEILETVLREMGYSGYSMDEMEHSDDMDEMEHSDDMDDEDFMFEMDDMDDDFYEDEPLPEMRNYRTERYKMRRESSFDNLRKENRRLVSDLEEARLNLYKLVKLHKLVVEQGLKPKSKRYDAVVDLLDEASTLKESQFIIDHTQNVLLERRAESKVRSTITESSTRQVNPSEIPAPKGAGWDRMKELMGT